VFTCERDSCIYDRARVKLGSGLLCCIFESKMWEEGSGGGGVGNCAVVEVGGGAVDDGNDGVVEVRGVLPGTQC